MASWVLWIFVVVSFYQIQSKMVFFKSVANKLWFLWEAAKHLLPLFARVSILSKSKSKLIAPVRCFGVSCDAHSTVVHRIGFHHFFLSCSLSTLFFFCRIVVAVEDVDNDVNKLIGNRRAKKAETNELKWKRKNQTHCHAMLFCRGTVLNIIFSGDVSIFGSDNNKRQQRKKLRS